MRPASSNKVIAKAMKQEAQEEMKVLCTKSNDVFKFVKFMRKERDIEGGGCMKENDGRLVVRDGHFRIPNQKDLNPTLSGIVFAV